MKKTITLILAVTLLGAACKKKSTTAASTDAHVPPSMTLKTGGKYKSADATVNKQDTILVGVTLSKTEDPMTNFNASYSYDGGTTTTTYFNHQLQGAESVQSYSTDVTYITRNQTGTETLIFSVVDRDGNITKKTIALTVQ
ncbi:MAG: hypothetical protein ACXVP0_01580 [Bacteroidia bacterium]